MYKSTSTEILPNPVSMTANILVAYFIFHFISNNQFIHFPDMEGINIIIFGTPYKPWVIEANLF